MAASTVSGTTNASGVVIFRVAGGGVNPGPPGQAAEPTANCIAVTADGVPLGSLSPAFFDKNGNALITGADFGLFQNDLFGSYRFRSDYNQDNALTGGDFALFQNQLFGAFAEVAAAAAVRTFRK